MDIERLWRFDLIKIDSIRVRSTGECFLQRRLEGVILITGGIEADAEMPPEKRPYASA